MAASFSRGGGYPISTTSGDATQPRAAHAAVRSHCGCRSPAQRTGLTPRQTASPARPGREDSSLAPLAHHPAGTCRPERDHPAPRGGVSHRLPQDRRITRQRSLHAAENSDRKALSARSCCASPASARRSTRGGSRRRWRCCASPSAGRGVVGQRGVMRVLTSTTPCGSHVETFHSVRTVGIIPPIKALFIGGQLTGHQPLGEGYRIQWE
jgi:hypothetical protein